MNPTAAFPTFAIAAALCAGLFRRLRNGARPRASDPLDLGPETLAAVEDLDDGPPRGCGWFLSSLELRSGLAVIEHELVLDFSELPSLAPAVDLSLC